MKIGEKIKAERLKAKMTQAQLAGNAITRNMLSQIESGAALPSLSTLLYLAQRLSLPAAYFISDDETPLLYQKKEALPKIWTAMQEARFDEVLAICEKMEADDELAYLAALSATQCGEKALRNGNVKIANDFFERAMTRITQTKYPCEHLRARLLLYGALAKNIASPQLVFDKDAYFACANAVVDSDLYHYVLEDTSYSYLNPLYARHMEAKKQMHARNWKAALAILNELEDLKSTPQVNAFLLFRLYSDMEICYRETQDYENAYRYSSKRMAQISAFQN